MLSIAFELFKTNLFFLKFFFCLILFLPFFSAFGLGFRSFYMCMYDTPTIYSLILIWLSFEGSFVLFDYFIKSGLTVFLIQGFSWFESNSFNVIWNFQVDYLTLIMFLVVTLISWFVHFYSIGYMELDPKYQLFFSYLSLFTFFMLILVSAGNLIQLFIGWEGVGLCSFLLISFWNTRIAANKSALKAMIVNKLGDYFLLVGISFLILSVGTVSFTDFFYYLSSSIYFLSADFIFFKEFFFFGYSVSLISVITFFFFLGIMAKSAQFGFHTWLPDAMEGPTPVSALIHAATMVTAGVFLLVRMYFLFLFADSVNSLIIFIGTLTTFFAATTALVQNDIKKIIAYSTCSQLGYMITACGFNLYGFALYHLVTHAFFKALLFLGAGSIIHCLGDEQDIRKMGGLALKLPITFFSMLIGSLSLVGFPFLSGFYSKEAILETILSQGTSTAFFAYSFGVISIFFTTFYSFRLLFLVFFVKPNGTSGNFRSMHKTSFYIVIPLICLSFLSIFLGYWINSFFLSLNLNFLSKGIFFNLFFKSLPLFFILLGLILSYCFYLSFYSFYFLNLKNRIIIFIYNFLNKKWFIDSVYNYYFSRFFFFFSNKYSFLIFEKGWIEYFGPFGISRISIFFSFFFSKFQTAKFSDYLFYVIASFVIFLLLI